MFLYKKIEPFLLLIFAFFAFIVIRTFEFFYYSFRGLKDFIIKWNEFITIPLGLTLVFWAERMVTYFYPTSTRYDVGFHYDVIYSLAAWLILHGAAYVIFKVNWAKMEKYVDIDLNKIWNDLTPYQQTKISIGLFFGYFFSAILTFMAVSMAG